MRNISFSIFTSVLLLLTSGFSHAALVGGNDVSVAGPDSGDGFNLTIDDQTGLEWLDLTITRGLSRNQVLASSLITSGAYRYATDVEVNNLFLNNVGIGFTGSEQITPNYGSPTIILAGRILMDFLGRTNTQEPIGSWGLVDDVTTLPGGYNTYVIRESTLPSTQLLRLNFGPDDSSTGYNGFGSFLVKATVVPEPSTYLLMGLGLLGLIALQRRRRPR
jgi:hypothetical protein